MLCLDSAANGAMVRLWKHGSARPLLLWDASVAPAQDASLEPHAPLLHCFVPSVSGKQLQDVRVTQRAPLSCAHALAALQVVVVVGAAVVGLDGFSGTETWRWAPPTDLMAVRWQLTVAGGNPGEVVLAGTLPGEAAGGVSMIVVWLDTSTGHLMRRTDEALAGAAATAAAAVRTALRCSCAPSLTCRRTAARGQRHDCARALCHRGAERTRGGGSGCAGRHHVAVPTALGWRGRYGPSVSALHRHAVRADLLRLRARSAGLCWAPLLPRHHRHCCCFNRRRRSRCWRCSCGTQRRQSATATGSL